MAKKKYQITPEHQLELEKSKQKYIDNARRTDPMTDFDKSQMRLAMRGLYKNANLPYPGDDKVIFVQSPLVAQFASGIAMQIIHDKKSNAAVNAAGNAGSIDIFLNAFIGLGKKYGKFALFSVSFSWRYRTRSSFWPWYQVFGDFFKNVAKLPGEWDKWDPLNLDCLHGGVRFMTPDFTIISDRPEIMKLDDQGRLHCETGPAVKWRDGMEQYYWHGISVPDHWVQDKKSITPKMALTWENMEQRRAACEIAGWANILKELKSKTIDKDINPQIGELVEVELPDVGTERFLRVLCGTGREFALCVTQFKHKTARECNAATYGWKIGMDINHFLPAIRT